MAETISPISHIVVDPAGSRVGLSQNFGRKALSG